jgi:hypothetical protein
MDIPKQFSRYCVLCGGRLEITSFVVEHGGDGARVRTRCSRCGDEAGGGWREAGNGRARSPALHTGDAMPEGLPLPDAEPIGSPLSPSQLRRESDRLFEAASVQLHEHGFSGLSRLVCFPIFVLSNNAPSLAPFAPHFAGYANQAGQQPRPGFSRVRLFYQYPPADAPPGTLLIEETDRAEEDWLPVAARQRHAVHTLSWFAGNFGTPQLRSLKVGGGIHQFVNIAAFLAAPVSHITLPLASGESLTWEIRPIRVPDLLTYATAAVGQASLLVAATGIAAGAIQSLLGSLIRLPPHSAEVRDLDSLLGI